MFKTLKSDVIRVVSNGGFASAIIATAILCFSAQVYTDYSSGKTYSVMDTLFAAVDGDLYPPVVITKALSGYSAMALPVTASLPFVLAFISERNSGNMIFTISRAKRGKYYFSKFISAILSGGASTLLGVILFGVFVYILFPNVNSPDTNNAFLLLSKKAVSAFIYGMTSVLPAFFICSFCKNAYIILCVPFMLKFNLETFLAKLQTNAVSAGNIEAYKLASVFYPDAASRLVDMGADGEFFAIIVLNVFLFAAAFAGFVIVMDKRPDRGH